MMIAYTTHKKVTVAAAAVAAKEKLRLFMSSSFEFQIVHFVEMLVLRLNCNAISLSNKKYIILKGEITFYTI